MSELYKAFDGSKLNTILESAHILHDWYQTRYGDQVGDNTEPSIRDKIIYSISLLWVNDQLFNAKSRIESMQRMIELVLKDDDKIGGISRFRLMGLLPDQEDIEIIPMPGEAPPVVASKRFEERSGRMTNTND